MPAPQEMHVNPGPTQALRLPCAKSEKTGGIQDMTTVASSTIEVYGPSSYPVFDSSVKRTTLTAVATSATSSLLVLIHQFAANEFTEAQGFVAGYYVALPIHLTANGTPVQGQPIPFRLRNPWERLRN
jgi:hypothetical protein